jgi:hypothetical protein
MGSPLKIASNQGRWSISLSTMTMWEDIVVNNVKITLPFNVALC